MRVKGEVEERERQGMTGKRCRKARQKVVYRAGAMSGTA